MAGVVGEGARPLLVLGVDGGCSYVAAQFTGSLEVIPYGAVAACGQRGDVPQAAAGAVLLDDERPESGI
jgi:hypothetical protein